MKRLAIGVLAVSLLGSCSAQRQAIGQRAIKDADIERIIRTLASDDMQGRATFTPGIEKAAAFIESEFKQIGLQPLDGEAGLRQSFSLTRIRPQSQVVTINDKAIDSEDVFVVSDKASANWTNATEGIQVIKIGPGQQLFGRYREILAMNSPALVLVDQQYADAFARLRTNAKRGRNVQKRNENSGAVFVLGAEEPARFTVSFTNSVESAPLFNIAGMLPGKSKPNEIVVFSGHYDHLGVIKPVEGDSIANGADDNASGTTAVITLARHFKKLNNNERTLIFVAFTAEEIGGYGARHFSSKVDPDDVVAMFNIEMIGKESKFGKNAAFITGYERSDFGEILQKNLEGTEFKFHPDPYPQQQLFYRSDNATLAALGVPAHTISTDQIDTDKFYHTVNDEIETLDIANIVSTIKAIAISSRSIVAGTDTPRRIPKL
ncbi:MAG TPA: M20/M25/M40 family metallo-hydrolase, partial [Sphingobacteriaceae bacterium]